MSRSNGEEQGSWPDAWDPRGSPVWGVNGFGSDWSPHRQRRPAGEFFNKCNAGRFQVMRVRDARDRHVDFTGPLAGAEKHPRAALRAESSFRFRARSVPAKKLRPSVDAELIGLDAHPADGRRPVGAAAGITHAVGNEGRRSDEREPDRFAHAGPVVFRARRHSRSFLAVAPRTK